MMQKGKGKWSMQDWISGSWGTWGKYKNIFDQMQTFTYEEYPIIVSLGSYTYMSHKSHQNLAIVQGLLPSTDRCVNTLSILYHKFSPLQICNYRYSTSTHHAMMKLCTTQFFNSAAWQPSFNTECYLIILVHKMGHNKLCIFKIYLPVQLF